MGAGHLGTFTEAFSTICRTGFLGIPDEQFNLGLIYCECLGDEIHGIKTGIKYSKFCNNESGLSLKQIKLRKLHTTIPVGILSAKKSDYLMTYIYIYRYMCIYIYVYIHMLSNSQIS